MQSATLVPSNTETTVASYTVPTGKTFYFIGFVGSGDVHGVYKLYVDSTAKLGGRSSVAVPTVAVNFPYAVFAALEGETVRVKATHFANSVQANFDATIIGYTL